VWQWLYPVTAIGTLFTLWLARGRIGRGPVTALFYFVGTLFPVLGFMNAFGMRYSFVWDHWVYLSALGIIALVAALVVRVAEFLCKPAVVYGFIAIVLPVLALLTWRQAGMYTDTETLMRQTLARNPDCSMAHNNLGLLLRNQGHVEEAMEHFHKSIQINPNSFEALNNLGVTLAVKGRLDEAIAHFQSALQISPAFAEAWYNLGIALLQKGNVDEAITHFQKAMQIKPDYAEACFNLGNALTVKGRFDEAIESYRQAIQVNPNHPETFFHLGMTLGQLGRTREAVAQYREALRLNPNLAGALDKLAWALATSPEDELRNGAEAVRLAERACELTHYGEPFFIGTLAAAYAGSGRFPEAVATAEKAEQLASSAGLKDLAEINRQLLERYRAGKPYRESRSASPTNLTTNSVPSATASSSFPKTPPSRTAR
jgi:tetratricopeptide (TPR) repeat protein